MIELVNGVLRVSTKAASDFASRLIWMCHHFIRTI